MHGKSQCQPHASHGEYENSVVQGDVQLGRQSEAVRLGKEEEAVLRWGRGPAG